MVGETDVGRSVAVTIEKAVTMESLTQFEDFITHRMLYVPSVSEHAVTSSYRPKRASRSYTTMRGWQQRLLQELEDSKGP